MLTEAYLNLGAHSRAHSFRVIGSSLVIKNIFHVSDAHTREDVDYRWKGGKSQGVEIFSKEMAQFEFVGAKTSTKANTNSKGKQF